MTYNIAKATMHWSTTSTDGVVLTLSGPTTTSNTLTTLYLNLYGDFWKLLPSGIETVARMTYLPLSLVPSYMNSTVLHKPEYQVKISLGTKEKGTIGVGRETIRKQLKSMIDGGDPFIEMEFRKDHTS